MVVGYFFSKRLGGGWLKGSTVFFGEVVMYTPVI